MLPPLTKKQKEMLDYIQLSIKLNGYSPSLEEIKEHFCLKAVSTVHEHIENLKNKGYIKKEMNQARGIQILSKKKMQTYKNIRIRGSIVKQEVKFEKEACETIVLDNKIIDKECTHFALKVQDDSLKRYGISEKDIVIISDLKPKEGKQLFIVSKKNTSVIQRANNSDLIDTQGYIKAIIKVF